MSQVFTIQEKITLGKISAYLAAQSNALSSIMQWGPSRGDERLPYMITATTESLEWAQSVFPNSVPVYEVADYLFALCGRFAGQAAVIAGNQTGQIIINPETGQPVNIAFKRLQFTVEDSGSTMITGQTVLVIADSNVVAGSISVFADSLLMQEGLTNQFSYTSVYAPNQTTITFNQGVPQGMTFIIEYVKTILI